MIAYEERPRLTAAGGGSSVSTDHPFKISLNSIDASTTAISVYPGALNQYVPSSMFTPYTHSKTSTTYVYLAVVTNGYELTSATLSFSASTTTPMETTPDIAPTSFQLLIGVVVNETIYQIINDNKNATSTLVLTESVATPTPGLSPYRYYYTWALSNA